MAYVVAGKRGFEIRESRSTPAGPRSRTLATFRELSDEVLEKARARAEGPIELGHLREAAIRAGAPLADAPVDRAAKEVLRQLATGATVDPRLKRLLVDALSAETRPALDGLRGTASAPAVSDAARAASQWIGASLEQRGEALVDLLGLAEALPFEIRSEWIEFPRLDSDRDD